MDMKKMLKQAQRMQADLAKAQEEVNQMTAEASAGGGVVKVVAGGDMTVKSIHIDPDAVDPEDVEMLEDLVTAAVNEALRSAQELGAARMNAITGGMAGMGLPGF
jgi:DNA-binding YbaB/EbfC family protein